MKKKIRCSILIIVLCVVTLKSNGQVTPPMGWNSWNKFRFNVSENLIKETADAMKKQKLIDCGYRYIVIDDGWQSKSLGKDSLLLADEKKFPNGIESLVDYVNALGFELGIYSSPNKLTCGGYPGSLGLERIHAKQFSDWGVKFVKYDYCPARNKEKSNSGELILKRLKAMHNALSDIDSSIVYAICEKGWVSGQIPNARSYRKQIKITPQNRKELFHWAPELGTMWRTTNDINPTWGKIMQILDSQEGLATLSGPDSFNDPDMLEVGNGKLTLSENRSHFSLWCILTAPLMLGSDVRNIPDEILEIITNKELIDINQDKLCKQAEKIYDENGIEIFLKPLLNKEMAVCILNRADFAQDLMLKWEDLGVDEEEMILVRDLWLHKNIKKEGKYISTKIDAHDVMVLRISKN
ncbi:glycoside hydrolase family 27 protein [Tamlana fucoidanivorans]|uniref:Alpha-galactosidase n=1 Tax=Allotamlana fucoidanivorans TaxID=2583814 RepID=A0A5C4SQ41_9FLAO|nr:glycoside hydrolase family 27 protein [Tamlana fucoidanivorans]TNJ46046.1 glycoside hydrolase family 27 protein [Tamlana fucoidanivorans]